MVNKKQSTIILSAAAMPLFRKILVIDFHLTSKTDIFTPVLSSALK